MATDTSRQSQELRLLLAWPAPLKVFAENLFDRLSGRVVPEIETTCVPDHGFWRDIDLATPLPRRGLVDSVFAHAALLGLLYAISIWPQDTVHLADSRHYRMLESYKFNEYLPELHGAPTHRKHRGKDDPVLAKQEIRSLPDAPDNLKQTIVTPPKVKLQHDVELPNLVVHEPVLPPPPLEAISRAGVHGLSIAQPEVIAPAAETGSLHSRSHVPSFVPQVVEPAPEIAQSNPRLALPAFQPNVVQPAPEVGSISRVSPRLTRELQAGADVAPPVPLVGDAHHSSEQFVALSLHPAEVHAPIQLPEGNRRGAFVASPSGHADAAGTGAEAASGIGAKDSNGLVNAPAGINVAAVVPVPDAPAMAAPTRGTSDTVREKLLVAMRTPPPLSIPPRQPVAHESGTAELERRLFAGRRSYTLAVNMPNLNAATGSWIIHFVERERGATPSQISAPQVVSKSDPAYPGELIQAGVRGTVILTAIIRADGSVTDIVVAKSLDPRLDRNAVQALERWLFLPALKDGHAIDLEAVITVPFHAKVSGF